MHDGHDVLHDRHVDVVRLARSRIDLQTSRPRPSAWCGHDLGRRSSPRPRFSPKVWLRDSGDMQVATRSPTPASPGTSRVGAERRPSRAISARPRVMTDALLLSPSPMPSAMPTASAMTFLTAPPISVADDVHAVYGRKYGVAQARATCSATGARRRPPRWRPAGAGRSRGPGSARTGPPRAPGRRRRPRRRPRSCACSCRARRPSSG